MVKRDGLVDKLRVTADGSGLVAHAGSALLAGSADRVGLTAALAEAMAMAPTRQRASAHDRGVVLRDLAVMLADGGDCLADLGTLRDQEDLFGAVASDSTAFRAIDSIDAECSERLRDAVAVARARAWQLGARPGRTVLDVDATLTGALPKRAGRRQLQGRLWPPSAAVLAGRLRRGAGRDPAARQRRLEHGGRSRRGARPRAEAT